VKEQGAALVFAVSDATGGTAEAAARAALAQFASLGETRVRLFTHVRDRRSIETIMAAAQLQGALVVYTLVEPDLRGAMMAIAHDLEVPSLDLLGPLVARLAQHLGRAPLSVPGLGHTTDAEYFRRIDAVEFTVRQDDGKDPRNLRRADLVFLGISRSGKTPLSHYVAQRGFKAANVPIVLDVPLPRELEEVDPKRVFGLLIDPLHLMRIRQTRMESLGMAPGEYYGELGHIRRELEYARNLYAQHPGWTVIDITRKAVEETAATVLQAYRERFEPPENGATALPLPPGVHRVPATTAPTDGTPVPAAPRADAPPVPPTPPDAARPRATRPAAGKGRPRKGS
jgi:regulator of PEP synthase PpsR (kinase-PPPase family)